MRSNTVTIPFVYTAPVARRHTAWERFCGAWLVVGQCAAIAAKRAK